MNTRHIFRIVQCAGVLGALLLTGCFENEMQVQELRQLREKLSSAEKKLATVASQLQASDSGRQDAVQRLKQAEERTAELEKKLKSTEVGPPTTPSGADDSVNSLGLLVETMEKDLFGKVEALCGELSRSLTGGNFSGATIRRLRPLDKIAAAYDSAITLKIVDEAGVAKSLVVEIQPGTDGRWQMPAVAELEKRIKEVLKPEWVTSTATHGGLHVPMAPLPLPPGYNNKPLEEHKHQPPSILWDSAPSIPPPTQTSPVAISSPVQINAATPPVKAASPLEKTPPPRVHQPVMPVQQDIPVRFE